jgi:hypothetical protein
MMRTLKAPTMAATIVLCLVGTNAEARQRHHHHHHTGGHHHYAARPGAWCGWYMRGQVGSDPGPSYNLARSWAHYGSDAGGPSVGAIVVWRHHVGKIVGHENGQWIVQSGNDGRAVRARPRSLAGAIAFRRAYAAF